MSAERGQPKSELRNEPHTARLRMDAGIIDDAVGLGCWRRPIVFFRLGDGCLRREHARCVPTLGTRRDAAEFGKGEVGNAFSIGWHLKLIEVASPALGPLWQGPELVGLSSVDRKLQVLRSWVHGNRRRTVMSNPIVRRNGGEQPRSPTEGEAIHWVHWDPFRQMAPFLTGEEHPAHYTPDFEIKETKDGFVFKADVPGIQEKDLEITMTGNRLTISGKREAEKEETSDTTSPANAPTAASPARSPCRKAPTAAMRFAPSSIRAC